MTLSKITHPPSSLSIALMQKCILPLPTISEIVLEGSAIEDDDEDETELTSSPSISSSPSFISDGSSMSTASSSSSSPPSSVSSSDSLPRTPLDEKAPLPSILPSSHKLRKNEHLAVAHPRHLWKPDSSAKQCDAIHCRRRFSLFERKHHCRKCGDIFCGNCSTHVTTLLDTTQLNFLHPPRGVPITHFASDISPVLSERVCDTCYYLINGYPDESSSASSSATSDSAASSLKLSSEPRPRPPLRRSQTDPLPQKSPRSRASSRSRRKAASPSADPAPTPDPQPSLGDLDLYPLSRHSSICKATGGGRWSPKPVRNWEGHRIPGGLAPYEVFLERKAEEERLRKLNPIIRNGEIQVRTPRPPEPLELRKPIAVSTF